MSGLPGPNAGHQAGTAPTVSGSSGTNAGGGLSGGGRLGGGFHFSFLRQCSNTGKGAAVIEDLDLRNGGAALELHEPALLPASQVTHQARMALAVSTPASMLASPLSECSLVASVGSIPACTENVLENGSEGLINELLAYNLKMEQDLKNIKKTCQKQKAGKISGKKRKHLSIGANRCGSSSKKLPAPSSVRKPRSSGSSSKKLPTPSSVRKPRKDSFPNKYPEVVQAITKFCLSHDFSQAAPDKTVTQHFDEYGNGKKFCRKGCTSHCKILARYDRKETWENGAEIFQKKFLPNIKTSCKQVTPQMLRKFSPFQLRKATAQTCMCGDHMKFNDFIKALYGHINHCLCASCILAKTKKKTWSEQKLRELIRDDLECGAGSIPKKICSHSLCSQCGYGNSNIIKILRGCKSKREITMRVFSNVENSLGNTMKVRMVARKQFDNFFLEFQQYIAKYLKHSAVVKCNSAAWDLDIRDVQPGEAVLLMDFQMNFSHKYKGTIQLEHWACTQTTLFPCIVYLNINEQIERWAINIVSNDQLHSNAFVTHATNKVLKYIEQFTTLHHLTIWTDGCGSQFKCKRQFLKISQMNMKVRHRFFASGHGKGPSDAEGAVVKCGWSAALTMKDAFLTTSKEAYEYAKKNFTEKKGKHNSEKDRRKANFINRRRFFFIDHCKIPAENQGDVTGLQGRVRSNHDFENTIMTGQLKIRWACCSCSVCCRNWHLPKGEPAVGVCENIETVGSFEEHALQTTTSNTMSADKSLQMRAQKVRNKIKKGMLLFVRSTEREDRAISPGEDPRNPGISLVEVLGPPQVVSTSRTEESLVNKRWQAKKKGSKEGKWVGDRVVGYSTQKWYDEQVRIKGKTNVLDNRKWAVPCRWFKSIYNEERNLMTYQPFYVDENKTKYYDTLLWEIMFRTHSLRPGTMLQIDKVPLYPIDPQIKKYDRPFAVKTRQFQAVIKQCRSDENLYQES